MSRGRAVRFAAVAVLVVGWGATGCGNDEAADGDENAAASTTAGKNFEDLTGKDEVPITVIDNSFVPRYIEVSVGTKLVFSNDGRNPHDIKAVDDGVWDEVTPEEFGPGATAEIVIAEAGEYVYYCTLHGTPRNGQNGIIKVVP